MPGETQIPGGAPLSVIQVRGLAPLQGEISIQGSKNAVLPMMAAALLHKGFTVLTNVPVIRDVVCMVDILGHLGCRCCRKGDCLMIDARQITGTHIPEEYVTAMRSSIVVLSALLGRMGESSSCYPGGCLIGARPIDLHMMVLRKLGARIEEKDGHIEAVCEDREGLKGTEIFLPYPSVGATEQAVLGAVLAKEVTIIHGAAMEPEIDQLCRFLNNMGAVVCGMGTEHIIIQGVAQLHDSSFSVEGDRIVAGTYGAAVMASMGTVILKGVRPSELKVPLELLAKAGASVRSREKTKEIEVAMKHRPGGLTFETGPYPEFPTDLQSPFMAFLAGGEGRSVIEERVFEGRFATVRSLEKMGASIWTQGQCAVIEGRYPLRGALVHASDLRGGAALAVAALAAEEATTIRDCHHIERGYEDICRDLAMLGADIRWVDESYTSE